MPRLAIIGAGSLRHSPAVIASLANYFGERELHIRLYDPIVERLQLFELLAQHCLVDEVSSTQVEAFEEPADALQDAELVIVQLDEESVGCYLRSSMSEGEPNIDRALAEILRGLHPEADVLSLLGDLELPVERYQAVDWPATLDEESRRSMPHQILRWVRNEEPVGPYLDQFERSPVKLWLEDPSSLPMVERS